MDFSALDFGLTDKDLALDSVSCDGYFDLELQTLLFDHIPPPQDQVPALEFDQIELQPSSQSSSLDKLAASSANIFNGSSQEYPSWDSQWFASFIQQSQDPPGIHPRHHQHQKHDQQERLYVEPLAVLALADIALDPVGYRCSLLSSLPIESPSNVAMAAEASAMTAHLPTTTVSQDSTLQSQLITSPTIASPILTQHERTPTPQPSLSPAASSVSSPCVQADSDLGFAPATTLSLEKATPLAFIPSTTKKSTTICKFLPAKLAYPTHLIPMDAPIQYKSGKRSASTSFSSSPMATITNNTVDNATNKKRKHKTSTATTSSSSTRSFRSATISNLMNNGNDDDDNYCPKEDDDDDERVQSTDSHFTLYPNEIDFSTLPEPEAKRIKNTLSARKSRARKQAKIDYLEQRVNELEAANQLLQSQLSSAQLELQSLKK